MRTSVADQGLGLRAAGRLALVASCVAAAALACSNDEVGSTIDAARQPSGTPDTGHRAGRPSEEVAMRLTSSAFGPGETIPRRYTCDGADVSPPLELSDIPEGTTGIVLIMDDPDAPGGTWDHWVAYDIPVRSEFPADTRSLGTAGRNSWGRPGYGGPCPPRGTHRYVFTAYALDTQLELPAGADKRRVLDALQGHVLSEARLMGRYERARG